MWFRYLVTYGVCFANITLSLTLLIYVKERRGAATLVRGKLNISESDKKEFLVAK